MMRTEAKKTNPHAPLGVSWGLVIFLVAEREGFEPPEDSRLQRFSRPPHSTTLPSLHWLVFTKYKKTAREILQKTNIYYKKIFYGDKNV